MFSLYLRPVNKVPISFTTIVESIATLYPNCVVNSNFSSDLMITADKGQLEQVLINVFKNAAQKAAKFLGSLFCITNVPVRQNVLERPAGSGRSPENRPRINNEIGWWIVMLQS